jgi:O-methyltransferase involved in polyketide biosynthesis
VSSITFTRNELASAIARGVSQCVLIGPRPPLREALEDHAEASLQVFALDDDLQSSSETLAAVLEKSGFDRLKASLFVWLGGAGYPTIEGVIASLGFIASLPKGSGVVFDYAVERISAGSLTPTALDALASRISSAGGHLKYLIQPQAVAGLLRGLGFQQIVDLADEELPSTSARLVSALV